MERHVPIHPFESHLCHPSESLNYKVIRHVNDDVLVLFFGQFKEILL